MSFGFSVSDFVYCAQLAYKLSVEFKEAPGACRGFTKDLLIFQHLLLKTQSLIEKRSHDLDESGRKMLTASAYSCKELLYVQILGCKSVPTDIESLKFDYLPMFYAQGRYLHGLRRKLGELKFAKRIPEFQSAISARVDALTALNIVLLSDGQVEISDSQARIEVASAGLEEALRDSRVQANSTAERLEQGQARIEAQLQKILASQQRQATPILSHSLDASSPEGRQTWMNLGRLLRAEGITPAMIDQNRDLLVKAMRTSLEQGQSLADSIPESYQTAPEWSFTPNLESYRASFEATARPHASHSNSVLLLGSAPPRNATFPDAFLERHDGKARSLDQSQNVANGIESLFDGMNHIGQREDDFREGDEIGAIDMELPRQGLPVGQRQRKTPIGSPNVRDTTSMRDPDFSSLQHTQAGQDRAATTTKPVLPRTEDLGANVDGRREWYTGNNFDIVMPSSGNPWSHPKTMLDNPEFNW